MAYKYIKARCAKHNKWFGMLVEEQMGGLRVVNFVGMTEDESKRIQTETTGTSFQVGVNLRPCIRCQTTKVGTCSHIQGMNLCSAPYNYQCLYCDQLRISSAKASSDCFNEHVGISNIPGVSKDRFGNPKGSQYDLAKDGGFAGFRILILSLYTGEGIVEGIRRGPMAALQRKGFEVELITSITPDDLRKKLAEVNQLWVISSNTRILTVEHVSAISDFYNKGNGVYIWGDNEPFVRDANVLAEALAGMTMQGNEPGDKVIGVQQSPGSVGIVAGHPIATGIVNLYEGITIATMHSLPGSVKPLIVSSCNKVVTAYLDDGKHRLLIDGGFTRLYFKWDTAGTDRLIVNCAAWLASGLGGGETPFT